jgi:hypothetical protein
MRKILAPLATAVLATTTFAATAAADTATGGSARSALDGSCQSGEFCLYYNSGHAGSFTDFALGVKDFSTVRFIADGAGKGELVKNNAASACNKDDNLTARVYFNSGWKGDYDSIAPGTCRNLSKTYNENASFQWIA